jgi:hypothetical protein
MRRVMMLMGMLIATSSWALEVHPDFRWGYGSCPTWGSGKYSAVQPYMFLQEGFDVRASNYPTSWGTRTGGPACRYLGCVMNPDGTSNCKGDEQNDPMPTAKPGEHPWPMSGSMCKVKTYILSRCDGGPNAGRPCQRGQDKRDCGTAMCALTTEIAKSYPVAYIQLNASYNGDNVCELGGSWCNPNGCVWDASAYNAPPAPAPTTTTMP